jgi:UDP-N-acetylmuramyl pentapeptide synthase
MRVEQTAGVTVVDDSYNANPASVSAALATLAGLAQTGRRIAVLGDMLELGPTAAELHAEVGREAAAHGIDLLVGAGPLMAHAVDAASVAGLTALAAPDSEAAGALLKDRVRPGDIVLFKGSRGMKMELAIEALRPPASPEGS